jgi:replicative DNA helicase
MTTEQLGERAAHAETSTPLSEDLTDVRALSEAEVRMAGSEVYRRMLLDARPRMTPERVLGVSRAEIAKHGALGLLVVDHLRHLEASPSPKEYEQVSASVAAAKRIAKDAPAPVLLLTHLSRERKEMRGPDAEPTLEMIRGSGRIEDDADNVLAIWRAEGRPTFLRVLKSRQGGVRPKIELTYSCFSQSYAEAGER